MVAQEVVIACYSSFKVSNSSNSSCVRTYANTRNPSGKVPSCCSCRWLKQDLCLRPLHHEVTSDAFQNSSQPCVRPSASTSVRRGILANYS